MPGPRTTLRPSLPNWPACSDRIELQERRAADPFVGRMRLPDVGIGNQVGPAGIEAGDLRRAALQGNVGAVVDGKRRAGGEAGDGIQLPAVHEQSRRPRGISPDRQRVASAEHEAEFGIEQRRAVLGRQVERILRQVVFSRHQRRRRAGHVQRGDIVQALRIPVRGQETQAVRILPRESHLQRVVSRAGIVRDKPDRSVVAEPAALHWRIRGSGCCSRRYARSVNVGLASMKRGRCVPLLPT